ncbi:VanZ family protein [Clostridium estertheticum]|uniref:VanZ family protein n=1 Tax=Clostridium estertheticum TaxID=238834 RepID=UPI001C0C1270|nr:VanZ family protein [Clostridium estertheticum]MBU3179399.1 VanZ family protein [Clostridium estertheticum]
MRKKHLNWILVVGWMMVIFIFSSQVGEVSNENNKFVIYVFNLLGLNLNSVFGTLSDFIVRKASHFTEYFILYMLIYRAMNKSKKIDMKIFTASILIVFLYACSDEFHQSFVPGRGPAFRDVMVDTCGGLAAFLFIYIRVALKKRPASNKVLTKFK